MVVVELLVNEEKLTALLREQSESESLDYKDAVDLSNPRHLVEFTKDVGAMQAFGGYLVIGVDAAGAPTGSMSPELARLFDEATLRPKLTKRLTLPFTVLSQSHLINGHTVILVYVGPHADGLAVFASDGLYDVPQSGGKSKSVTLFRAGEVFVRHGTSSERWNQSDVPRLLAKRDARIREEARADLASALAAVERGTRAQGLARGPVDAFTSQLDQGTFDATATELLRTGDRTPIRLLLVRAVGDAEASVLGGDLEGLQTLLDRLVALAAIAITVDLPDACSDVVRTLVAIYRLGFDSAGGPRNGLPVATQDLWPEVTTRVEALGALAVRLGAWRTVRELAVQSPRTEDDYYPSWLRHGQVNASRSDRFRTADGKPIPGMLVALGRNHAHRLPALRPDRQDDSAHNADPTSAPPTADALLDSLCQFDALAGVVAMAVTRRIGSSAFYPSFVAYYSHRTEPVLVRLVTNTDMRDGLLPGVPDDTLRAAITELIRMAKSESWNNRHEPWDLDSEAVRAFLDGSAS